jgi:GNAT superfamily N-acetyltransferase
MMSQLKPAVRRANLGDIDTLTDFNCRLAQETEGETLNSQIVHDGVRRGLEKDEEVVYYIAEVNSDPVGALMLTREWSDWRNGWMIWLQSVYVRQDYRGQGVFRGLLDHVVHLLERTPDVAGLRLYVSARNTQAQAVYRQSGFIASRYRILERQFDTARIG